MLYGLRFDQVLTQSGRDFNEIWYSFGVSLAILLPMLIGWELLRYMRPSKPQRVPAVSFVFISIFSIALVMLLQFTAPGSSAQGSILAAGLSLSVAGSEVSRSANVKYGVEARLCTTISGLISMYVVMRKEAEALGIASIFYTTAVVWSLIMTAANLFMRVYHREETIETETDDPESWFGALTRAIKSKVVSNHLDSEAVLKDERKARRRNKRSLDDAL